MNQRVYKVNYLNGLFWLKPTFLNSLISKRGYNFRPFKTLSELVSQMDLEVVNCRFLFNASNHNIAFFNELQKIKNLPFRLNQQHLKLLEQNAYVDVPIGDITIIRYDQLGLKQIMLGNLPFYGPRYFDVFSTEVKKVLKINKPEQKIICLWRKHGFDHQQIT